MNKKSVFTVRGSQVRWCRCRVSSSMVPCKEAYRACRDGAGLCGLCRPWESCKFFPAFHAAPGNARRPLSVRECPRAFCVSRLSVCAKCQSPAPLVPPVTPLVPPPIPVLPPPLAPVPPLEPVPLPTPEPPVAPVAPQLGPDLKWDFLLPSPPPGSCQDCADRHARLRQFLSLQLRVLAAVLVFQAKKPGNSKPVRILSALGNGGRAACDAFAETAAAAGLS